MKKVLVLTGDVIAPQMAGPAIRATELARVISKTEEVTLASTISAENPGVQFPVLHAKLQLLRELVAKADVVIVQGFVLAQHPWIVRQGKLIVADLYDPMHLEQLEATRPGKTPSRARNIRNTIAVVNEQLQLSDFFICASEKQRDFWLGHLSALGRINTETYDADTSLRSLIDVVPFGIQETEPVQTSSAIKGKVPGISITDKVILWGGGIYDWFDPLTLIRAMAILRTTLPQAKLFFLSAGHPNPLVTDLAMSAQARRLSDELGLTGENVFFNQDWVEYANRQNYLLDADLGVSTHFDHLETRFSFRTRLLDYLWAGLPIVATDGDTFAEVIRAEHIGEVVAAEQPDLLAAALYASLTSDTEIAERKRNIATLRETYFWDRAAQPLVKFIAEGHRAPDLRHGKPILPLHVTRDTWFRGKVRGARQAFRKNGFAGIVNRIMGKSHG